MKVAFISAPLTATTGYGKVTKEICHGLADMGYEVINIGGRGSAVAVGEKFFSWTPEGNRVRVLPAFGQTGDHKTIEYYIRRYGIDVVISLYDAFVLSFGKPSRPWAAQFPIDTHLNQKWINYVLEADFLVAMSEFGYKELLQYFPDFMVRCIPHGVDINIFKPRTEEEKMEIRKRWRIPENAFVYLDVAANWGERKCLPQLMITFKRALEDVEQDRPKILYLYTNFKGQTPVGYRLDEFADMLGITNNIMGPAFNPMLDSIEDEKLAELYSACDVLVNPSFGEGFGLPIIEAEASGTPVIATKSSSIIELVEGHGWLVETVPKEMWEDIPVWVPMLARYPVPNLTSLLDCMNEAYNNPEKVRTLGEKAAKFAENYSWSKQLKKWDTLIREMEEIGG